MPISTATPALLASSQGRGVSQLFPSLAASASVRSADRTTLIRVILRGAQSVATETEPTAPAMSSFAWQLTDEEVAAVITFIRNSWGAAAPAVMAETVSKLRAALASRTG